MIETAEHTLDRLMEFDSETNAYAGMARGEYGDSLAAYREGAIEALENLEETEEADLHHSN